jgi:shikimate 5-dehydrogenase
MALSISSVSSLRDKMGILDGSNSVVGIEDMADVQLANTKILIVGGGSGMGLALAKRCLDARAQVIIAGRNEEKLARACEELRRPAQL